MNEMSDQTSTAAALEVGTIVTQGWTEGRVGDTMTMRMFLGTGYGVWIQLPVVIRCNWCIITN